MRRALLAWLAAWLIRAWLATLRFERVGPPLIGPGLVAFWHGDQLPLLGQRPEGPSIAPVSLSPDGRLQARILARLGIESADGSSSRGGARALRGLLRGLRREAVVLMAVDGPRGPRGTVQPGVIYLARKTGAPIWAAGVAVGRGHRLRRAWDRYVLPCPFTKVVVTIAPAWYPPRDVPIDAARVTLARRIGDACAAARVHLGQGRPGAAAGSPPPP